MSTFLVICLIAAMAATVFALVRGIVQFLKTSHEDLTGSGPNLSGERQNRMMRLRIVFQALAILVIILLLMLRQSGS
jgi:hypothetical protein